MENEFEKRAIEKLSNIEKIVEGLDTLNRNIEEQVAVTKKQNENIEKLIKILVEKEEKRMT